MSTESETATKSEASSGLHTAVYEFIEQDPIHGENLELNMGPQHPATHGVLRLKVTLDGERIVDVDPVIGYLHRGKEKMAESLGYHRWFPHTDRLDYLSPFLNNIGYALAVEKMMELEVPKRAQYIRVIIGELARIASHLIYTGCTGIDLGAVTVFFYTFKERERIYDVFDRYTGHRMNNTYVRFGGVAADFDDDVIAMIRELIQDLPTRIDEYEYLLTSNRIWYDRNKGVAQISAQEAIDLGLTGPNLRGSGVAWDLRKTMPYSSYEDFDFEVPIGTEGDAYDRYLVRIEEMRQSVRIIHQALENLPPGEVYAEDRRYVLPPRPRVYDSMEELIHQFKVVTDMRLPKRDAYTAIEASKGELGFYIVSRGERAAHRCHVRSPSLINLQALRPMAIGRLFSDMVAIIGSLDFVMGEVDK